MSQSHSDSLSFASINPSHTMRTPLRFAHWILLLAILPVAIAGCDLFGTDGEESLVTTDVVLANSGSFTAQDGSLTFYDPEEATTSLRDINVAFINSMTVREERLYVVDNTEADNAGRITIFDTESFEAIDQIQNPRPPRSMAFASDNKAYVTNLSEFDENFNPEPSTVSVVDLGSFEVTEQVDVGKSPEGIEVASGKAFVANSDETTVSVIDVETDEVTNTLDLECVSPKEVFVDEENEVVVVCQGSGANDGEVVFLDPESESIVTSVDLEANIGSVNGTQSAYYSSLAEELYAVSGSPFSSPPLDEANSKIYRLDTQSNVLSDSLGVPSNESLIGISAVGYDPVNQDLYVARFPVGDDGQQDPSANGQALVLDRSGSVTERFETGNSPGHFSFLRDMR